MAKTVVPGESFTFHPIDSPYVTDDETEPSPVGPGSLSVEDKGSTWKTTSGK